MLLNFYFSWIKVTEKCSYKTFCFGVIFFYILPYGQEKKIIQSTRKISD